MILRDHAKIKELFDRFENAESASEKELSIAKAVTELNIHAVVEEEVSTRPCASKWARIS
jgi:hypothetical protein